MSSAEMLNPGSLAMATAASMSATARSLSFRLLSTLTFYRNALSCSFDMHIGCCNDHSKVF